MKKVTYPGGRHEELTCHKEFTYDGEDVLRERIVGVPNRNLRYVHGPGIDEPLAVEDMSTTGALT